MAATVSSAIVTRPDWSSRRRSTLAEVERPIAPSRPPRLRRTDAGASAASYPTAHSAPLRPIVALVRGRRHRGRTLVPLLVTTLMYPPSARPSSACPPDVTTWNWSTASTPYGIPLSAAASSLADRPSTMKLLERLRWLPIDRPTPWHRGGLGKELRAAADVRRRDARNQQREIQEVATVERQIPPRSVRPCRRPASAPFRGPSRPPARSRRPRPRPAGQLNGQVERGADRQRQRTRRRRESGLRDDDLRQVRARR